jgi:hypothetical protein
MSSWGEPIGTWEGGGLCLSRGRCARASRPRSIRCTALSISALSILARASPPLVLVSNADVSKCLPEPRSVQQRVVALLGCALEAHSTALVMSCDATTWKVACAWTTALTGQRMHWRVAASHAAWAHCEDALDTRASDRGRGVGGEELRGN